MLNAAGRGEVSSGLGGWRKMSQTMSFRFISLLLRHVGMTHSAAGHQFLLQHCGEILEIFADCGVEYFVIGWNRSWIRGGLRMSMLRLHLNST